MIYKFTTEACVFVAYLLAAIVLCALPCRAETEPDPRTERLCHEAADPDAAPDKLHINCRPESGTFATDTLTEPVTELIVVAYNMERGMHLDEQIEFFKTAPGFRDVDVLLVSEADRGCSRTDYRNVPRELARALDMNYVFGVEYMELPRKTDKPLDRIDALCEHGNAVLSRFPITNPQQIRHARSKEWYIPPGPDRENHEPRLGGGMAVSGDLVLPDRTVRVYSIHLDSDLENADIRETQALELTTHAADFPGTVIMGGDCNTYPYLVDLQAGALSSRAVQTFFAAGYADAHAGMKPSKRGTTNREYGARVLLDLIFVRGATVSRSSICPGKHCDRLSDHLPVLAEIVLP